MESNSQHHRDQLVRALREIAVRLGRAPSPVEYAKVSKTLAEHSLKDGERDEG